MRYTIFILSLYLFTAAEARKKHKHSKGIAGSAGSFVLGAAAAGVISQGWRYRHHRKGTKAPAPLVPPIGKNIARRGQRMFDRGLEFHGINERDPSDGYPRKILYYATSTNF